MDAITSRAYAGAPDLELLIDFARASTAARWPLSTYKKVGDVVWLLFAVGFDPSSVRLWFNGSELAGYASFEPPMGIDFDIRPGSSLYDSVGEQILSWGESRARDSTRAARPAVPRALAMLGYQRTCLTMALESDHERVAFLERHGYRRQPDGFDVLYRRSLDGFIAEPKLDSSHRLRHATDADLDERVDVHRDAWSVWGPSRITVEGYRHLRSAPVYDEELDVVLEDTATHRILSYCIGWLDTANRIGHFEPVGCRPAFTGRGYARAVTIEGMRRMQARGMHTALVSTASVNERARVLYPSCGFVEVDRVRHYVKPLNA